MTRKLIQRMTYLAGLAALAAMVSAGIARADTIFTNLGASGGFNTHLIGAYVMTGSGNGGGIWVEAMPFTAGMTDGLTDAVLALGNDPSTDNSQVTVDLESDSSGLPSGTILATLTQQGTIPSEFSPGLVAFDCTGACPMLDSGTPYWLVATVTDPSSRQQWFANATGDSGLWVANTYSSTTGPWLGDTLVTLAAFQVDGAPATTPTAEPASFLLFGTGLIGLVLAVRKRSRQQKEAVSHQPSIVSKQQTARWAGWRRPFFLGLRPSRSTIAQRS